MYAVMWSEHCSYKSSKTHLRRLPTEAPWVLVGPGEGAGVIDVGDGLAVAVRIESHNHPSAVEPYQGAATGVGGIIRDVFSMGARPIALMDPLRFGPLDDARTRYLFEGVVSGISGYGNAVGVPTVGGEVVFDDCYRENPLVNVLCLGVLPQGAARARARRRRRATSRCCSARRRGATASAARACSRPPASTRDREAKRPSVQVGDPFEEKRLIEACLELLDAGLAVGVQDLGAAGLSCAASETAAKAGAGMDVDVARVAKREPGMNPVEVLTSESQERMLAIVEPRHLDEVLELCERWEIRATVVGRVTDTASLPRVRRRVRRARRRRARTRRRRAATTRRWCRRTRPRSPTSRATASATGPRTSGRWHAPRTTSGALADDPAPLLLARFPDGADLGDELLALLGSPTIADKSWVWRQYDHQLFLNTVVGPGADATVLRLKGTDRGARAGDRRQRRGSAGSTRAPAARLAVLEAARNVVVRRRRAARPRQLPQLRQPGAPRGDVAVLGGRRRHEPRRAPRSASPSSAGT